MVSPELAPGPETGPAPPGRRPSGKTMTPEAATDQDAAGRHQAPAGRWRTMERKATRIADMLDEPTPGMPIAVDLEPRRCHPDTASACQLCGTVRERGRHPAASCHVAGSAGSRGCAGGVRHARAGVHCLRQESRPGMASGSRITTPPSHHARRAVQPCRGRLLQDAAG